MNFIPSSLRRGAAVLASLGTLALFPAAASAALVLEVTEYTSSTLQFNISGTLDNDTVGTAAGTFFVAMDGQGSDFFEGNSFILANTMQIGGSNATATVSNNSSFGGDSIYFNVTSSFTDPVPAGTTIAGSMSIAFSPGGFDTMPTLELWSGWDGPSDFNRLETVAVPEPGTYAAIAGAFSLLLAFTLRRRRK